METLDRILELLYDREGGFVALTELARSAGVGPEAVTASLEELERRGQRLAYSPSEGVGLLRPIRLASCLIERDLGTVRVGRSAICFEHVESTNDVAMAAVRQDDADGLVVLAESQRLGRGRRGREWVSPPGRNVLLSVLLIEPADAAGALPHEPLPIAAGLAVAEAVEQATHLPCELKWPNDVLIGGAKAAGILVETRRRGSVAGLVIGVGLNVNVAPPAERIDQPATSLADQVGHPVERTEIVRGLLRRLDTWIGRIAAERLDDLHDGFLARCRMVNQRIEAECGGRQVTGRVLDVDPLRGLIVADDTGRRCHLPAESTTLSPKVR